MATSRKQDGFVQTAIRLPPDLHKAVHEAAAKSERSFNGQIIATLRAVHLPEQEVADAKP